VVLAIGSAVLIFGLVEAIPSGQLPIRHFAPSLSLQNVLHDGTRIRSSNGFLGCPNGDVLGSPAYTVTWAGGDRDVTLRVGDQIDVAYDSDAFYLPRGDAFCFVQSAGRSSGQIDTLQAVHPGSQIVFENRSADIEVIKITVLAPAPTNVWAVVLIGVGGGLVVVGIAMVSLVHSRRLRSRPPTPPSGAFDRQPVYT
jgi:hypothetical protein